MKAEAAPTKTGHASTVRWRGSGKRNEKVYVRNQRPKASQDSTTSSNLTDAGAGLQRVPAGLGRAGNSLAG